MQTVVRLILIVAVLWIACPAHAVILYGKRVRNMSAPAGSLANSGWQWEGQWSDFLGTVISKNTFITAEHVGGSVGDSFTLNGVSYRTTATWDDPQSDLQIWAVKGRFASWAPLLRTYTEPGSQMVVFGRGTARGPAVAVNSELKGWLWGASDHEQSWGMNVIKGSAAGRADSEAGGGRVRGAQLYWTFDRNGLGQESMLSSGDSGGGVFVRTGNTWSLAGVNYGAQADFSYAGSPDNLKGALFDLGGLKVNGSVITDTSQDIPASAFATRVSLRVPWITDVLTGKIPVSAPFAAPSAGVPEPGMLSVLVTFAMIARRRTQRI
jgi:hypothetical protein